MSRKYKNKRVKKKKCATCTLFCLERVMRIELTTTAWEAVVLPLNYTRTSEQTTLSAF